MRAERRPRSRAAAFRGALWITVIALVTTSVALSVQYLQTTRLIEAQTRGLLDDETASLIERYEAGGAPELAAFLGRQQELPRFNEFFYLFTTHDGTPLAGNLSAWPTQIKRMGLHRFSTTVMAADGKVRSRTVEARAMQLGDRYRLLVGHFAEGPAELRGRYLSALFWSLLVTGLLGLLLGWWYSRRGLAFVEKVSATGVRFLAGNLEERVPVSERGDEYDRLAATINACFVEIEHVVRSLRAATDGMAHDLKTPLTRINARLELSRMRKASAADLRQVIEDTRSDLAGLLRIIEDMLNLARAESTTAASFVDVDLAAIVAEAVELYQPVAEDRDVMVRRELEPASLHGAPGLLSQMAVNLIDNAIKYSPRGGMVEVRIAREPDAITLIVADQGPGIPVERRADVLSRFVRLDDSRGLPGIGIGLSIVNAAARVHRASLELSDNSPGLRAEIHFPIEAASHTGPS